MATPGDERGPGYVYILGEATPRGAKQYYRVGHCADLHARLQQLSTANPLGLCVIASFLVQNMLAAEQAAKSALSSIPELRLNDLGGDGDWYFGTDRKPAIQEIVRKTLETTSKYLLEEPASTVHTSMSTDATRAAQKELDSAYLVSTDHNNTPCFLVVASDGDDVVLEIAKNNPTKVCSAVLPVKDGSREALMGEIKAMETHLKVTFPTGQTLNGWRYGTGPEKLSIKDILDRYQKSWCSIM